ncbi:Ig-like domain-containing protein [Catenulispora yoronensis]|uniref:Ig-like domain-containing protein n=1 Tax=Catenulispora yoronensis TaxID=450799 RepID=UPI0031D0DF5B
MRGTPATVKKAVLACGAAGIALGLAAPAAFAAAGRSHYAAWDFAGESVTTTASGFPSAHVTTDSLAPSSASGQSAFLNAATPFGQVFGSSQGHPYALLRTAAGRAPSTTVLSFARPLAAGTWGFALGDVDAETVQVIAFDQDGRPLPASALGFQGTFNYCAGSPLPSSCVGQQGTDLPVWEPGTGTLVGNVADTNGASGWFRPTAAVATLEFHAAVQSGLPTYQLWLAADDQPPAVRERPAQPPILTSPGRPVVIPVCEGAAQDIGVLSGARHGKISSHPNCTVTYTPASGFSGDDAFTLRIVTADGQVLVKSFDVRVRQLLAQTGTADDLVAMLLAAGGLLGAGLLLTVLAPRADRSHWRASGDTMDS